jgi:hypothetical protein
VYDISINVMKETWYLSISFIENLRNGGSRYEKKILPLLSRKMEIE